MKVKSIDASKLTIKKLRVRIWLGSQVIKLAALIIGCSIEIISKESKDNE